MFEVFTIPCRCGDESLLLTDPDSSYLSEDSVSSSELWLCTVSGVMLRCSTKRLNNAHGCLIALVLSPTFYLTSPLSVAIATTTHQTADPLLNKFCAIVSCLYFFVCAQFPFFAILFSQFTDLVLGGGQSSIASWRKIEPLPPTGIQITFPISLNSHTRYVRLWSTAPVKKSKRCICQAMS